MKKQLPWVENLLFYGYEFMKETDFEFKISNFEVQYQMQIIKEIFLESNSK